MVGVNDTDDACGLRGCICMRESIMYACSCIVFGKRKVNVNTALYRRNETNAHQAVSVAMVAQG